MLFRVTADHYFPTLDNNLGFWEINVVICRGVNGPTPKVRIYTFTTTRNDPIMRPKWAP